MNERLLRFLPEVFRDLFYPPHCPACGNATENEDLCGTCKASLFPVEAPFCPICSRPMQGLIGDSCVNCRGRNYYLHSIVSPFQSRGVLREMLHRFKYGRELYLRKILGRLIFEGMRDNRICGVTFDCIVPVPLHPLKKREREFNQAEEISRVLSVLTGIPTRNFLKRERYTSTQTRFDRSGRMRNLQGAFKVSKNRGVNGKTILLLDDVVTTASTLDECAHTLLDSDAEAVYGITVARG